MNSRGRVSPAAAFFFEPHLAHVPLRGSSVPCHPSGGAVFFGSYGYSFAGVADMAFDHAVQSPPCSLCARWRRRSVSFVAPNGVTTAAGLNILVERIAPTEIIYQIATHYILGCDDEVGNGCKTHFVKADSAELAKNGKLSEYVEQVFGDSLND